MNTAQGEPTSALYGFAALIVKMLRDRAGPGGKSRPSPSNQAEARPSAWAAFAGYKASRPAGAHPAQSADHPGAGPAGGLRLFSCFSPARATRPTTCWPPSRASCAKLGGGAPGDNRGPGPAPVRRRAGPGARGRPGHARAGLIYDRPAGGRPLRRAAPGICPTGRPWPATSPTRSPASPAWAPCGPRPPWCNASAAWPGCWPNLPEVKPPALREAIACGRKPTCRCGASSPAWSTTCRYPKARGSDLLTQRRARARGPSSRSSSSDRCCRASTHSPDRNRQGLRPERAAGLTLQ